MTEARSEPGVGPFDGRVVVVIGAASGIGTATARLFAERGAQVVLADRDEDGGRVVTDELLSDGFAVVFHGVDITRREELERLAVDTVTSWGSIDTLFVSAGRAESDLGQMLALFLEGPARCAEVMTPYLRQGTDPTITFTGSMSGLRAHRGAAWYSAAKTGIVGLTRSLALDLAPDGIRVNSVCPSGVDTAMLRQTLAAGGGDPQKAIDRQAARKPLRRWVRPQDVAEAACFLASPQAAMITGVSLPVDGGESL